MNAASYFVGINKYTARFFQKSFCHEKTPLGSFSIIAPTMVNDLLGQRGKHEKNIRERATESISKKRSNAQRSFLLATTNARLQTYKELSAAGRR